MSANLHQRKISGPIGGFAIEALEDRRLLSATIATSETVSPAATSQAVATTQAAALPLFTPETIAPTAGVQFSGALGTLSGALPPNSSILIYWGDASSSSPATLVGNPDGTVSLEGTHTYANVGFCGISLALYTDGVFVSIYGNMPVVLVTPASPSTPVVTVETGNDYFTAPGSLDFLGDVTGQMTIPFPLASATINWGDGSTSTGDYLSVEADAPGQWLATFSGSHTYAAAGSYAVTVSAVAQAGFGLDSTPVVVAKNTVYASPSLALNPTAGDVFSGTVATLPPLGATPGAVTIDCGDGTPASEGVYSVQDTGVAVVTGSHTYAAEGNYLVTITATTGSNSSPTQIAFSNAVVAAAPLPPSGTLGFTGVGFTDGGFINIPSVSVFPPVTETNPLSVPSDIAPVASAANGGAVSTSTVNVAGASLDVAWSTPKLSKLPATAPTVVIHWGDRTAASRTTALENSTTDELSASATHVYRKAGTYRAVAVFMEGRKVIRRVIERLKISKA